ncbi:MAG: regulatory protein RecX [Candidatus Peregrinibacteria bacterium]|nr:regulatory protein RecX [Candidatus Peregrinibacteria bacterium]
MVNYEKLIQYALRIIAKKRYTSFEMEKKLKLFVAKQEKIAQRNEEEDLEEGIEKSLFSADIEKVLERLKELKYLNDSGYAEDYIADKIRFRPRGKFLLARELKLKGLDSDLIKNALEKQNIDESGIAAQALERKMRQWQNLPLQKQRERAYRFLASKGFEPDAIYKAVNCCYSKLT